jgi:hypothetical protein
MNKNKTVFAIAFVIISIVIAIASRLVKHPLNMAPMIGIALFSVAYLPKKWMGLVLPVACWIISDVFVNVFIESATPSTHGIGYFITPTALGVYTSLLVVFVLGGLLRKGVTVPKLLGITLSSSLIFYFVTNSFCFFEGNLYGSGFTGYVNCLLAGIPFYKNDYGTAFGSFFFNGIMGDLFFTSLLFGSYYLVNRRSLKPVYV